MCAVVAMYTGGSENSPLQSFELQQHLPLAAAAQRRLVVRKSLGYGIVAEIQYLSPSQCLIGLCCPGEESGEETIVQLATIVARALSPALWTHMNEGRRDRAL